MRQSFTFYFILVPKQLDKFGKSVSIIYCIRETTQRTYHKFQLSNQHRNFVISSFRKEKNNISFIISCERYYLEINNSLSDAVKQDWATYTFNYFYIHKNIIQNTYHKSSLHTFIFNTFMFRTFTTFFFQHKTQKNNFVKI